MSAWPATWSGGDWPAAWSDEDRARASAALAAAPRPVAGAASSGARTPNTPAGWPQKKIRETFVGYFKSQQHTHWPSSSVVPHEDPTLLFANAGMNQYKSIFLGAASGVFFFFSRSRFAPGDYTTYLPTPTRRRGERTLLHEISA